MKSLLIHVLCFTFFLFGAIAIWGENYQVYTLAYGFMASDITRWLKHDVYKVPR